MPPKPPPEDVNDFEEGTKQEETDSLDAFPSTIPLTSSPRTQTNRTPNTSYKPISAAAFFDKASEISAFVSQLLLRTYYTPPKVPNGTVMVCHYGVEYSGLFFAQDVSQVSNRDFAVVLFYTRRHSTISFPENIEWLQ